MSTEQELMSKMLSQMSGTVQATDITNIDRLKVAAVGESGVGKSFTIAKGSRKPHLHYDFDDRRESIAGIKGVTIKTLVDKNDTSPVAWNELESDIGSLEYAKSKDELPFKSVALDSMTFLRKYAEHQLLKDSNTITRSKFRIGSTEYLVPKDWDAVTGVQKMLETMLNRFFALDIDVYAIFHTRQEKDNVKSTKFEPVYKETLTVEPQNLKMLLPKFNDVWRFYVDGTTHKIQLKPDWKLGCRTVLKNVNECEDADIQQLLAKHKGGK